MQPYQQRVVDEKAALDEKIEKLCALPGTILEGLSENEQDRLRTQLHHMKQYSDILGQRIEAFT